MKRFHCSLVALSLLLGGAGLAMGQPSYTYTTIDVPGSMSTQAFGINDSGQIVGNYRALGLWPQGFLLSGASYSTVQISGFGTFPQGINNAGQIVGYVTIAVLDHPWRSTDTGFLLSGGASMEVRLPNSLLTQAFGINDSGQIVGVSDRGSFLYSGGSYTTLDLASASGINDSGQIVGQYTDLAGTHGFLLSQGSYTTLDVPDSMRTGASGINDAGQIVGSYTDAGGMGHGFLLSGGTFTTIHVPGSTSTAVTGINNGGQIVGYYIDAGGAQHGFLATPVSSFAWHGPEPIFTGVTGNPSFVQATPGTYGTKGNYELVVPLQSGGLAHFERNNDDPNLPWFPFATDPGAVDAVSLIQSNFTSSGSGPANLAVVARIGNALDYFFREDVTFTWSGPTTITTGVTGVPSFVQARPGTFGTKGNYELVVPLQGGGIGHFYRDNDDPNLPWNGPVSFGTDLGLVDTVSIVQSNFSTQFVQTGVQGPGNLAVVARIGDQLVYFYRDDVAPFDWHGPTMTIAMGVSGNPSFVQARPGTYGTMGNYELVVPLQGGGIGHFERNNDDPNHPWNMTATFGTSLGVVGGVSLIQSNFSTAGNGLSGLDIGCGEGHSTRLISQRGASG